MDKLTTLFRRAKQVCQTEGLSSMLRQAFAFVGHCLFEHGSYWLYAEPTDAMAAANEADFLPPVDGFRFEIVASNQRADELEADGLEFRSRVSNGRARLDSGVVAFCVFAGHELAGISWVAMSQQAKDTLPERPYHVDFSSNEACGGDAWTNPKYRRMGVSVYRTFRINRFLRESGVVVRRNASRKGSVWQQKLAARFNRTKYGEGRYLRVLWWKSWREKPLADPQRQAQRLPNG